MQVIQHSGLALELVCRSLAQQLWLLEDILRGSPHTPEVFELQQAEVRNRLQEAYARWRVLRAEDVEEAWVAQTLLS